MYGIRSWRITAWGLALCEGTAGKVASVDLLDVVGTDITWKHDIGDDELEKVAQKIAGRKPRQRPISGAKLQRVLSEHTRIASGMVTWELQHLCSHTPYTATSLTFFDHSRHLVRQRGRLVEDGQPVLHQKRC
ncbi:hypothetical protein PMIN07_010532 [Paraphaeosphaeria minitans]